MQPESTITSVPVSIGVSPSSECGLAPDEKVVLLRRRARTLDVVAVDPDGEVMKCRPFDERLRRARRKERFKRVIAQLQLT